MTSFSMGPSGLEAFGLRVEKGCGLGRLPRNLNCSHTSFDTYSKEVMIVICQIQINSRKTIWRTVDLPANENP